MKFYRTLPAITLFTAGSALAAYQEKPLEEVVVNAEFHEKTVLDTATSVSIIGQAQLRAREASHLEDVLNIIPNVNFSSGASRGRFFQIRGIGERSQFVDPINPSVGLIIDGIDFTGVGGAATTLDIKQVEVLRGPQGTLYGANALAGLINIVSQDPSESGGSLRLALGEFNTRQYEQVISGPVSDDISMRIALSKNQSDGYTSNVHLNRDNTENIDETTIRTKLHWQANDDTLIKFTSYIVDADNGYDAFSYESNRQTITDQPGHDRVNTRALALGLDYAGFDSFKWETNLSAADSDLEYGFDEDWSFRTVCAIDSSCAFFQYSTFDNYQRDNKNISLDSRLVSNSDEGELSWVSGIYYRAQDVDLLRTYTNNDPNGDSFYGPIVNPEITLFGSNFETKNIAAYGQLGVPLGDTLSLIVGLRAETRKADYSDSNNNVIENNEDFAGGKLALEYRGIEDHLFYGLVSRGYKAGGNNIPGSLDASGNDLIPIIFDTEFMWNFELGHKATWLSGKLDSQISLFYQDRDDIQVRQSLVTSRDSGEVNGDCPCSFTDFIGNAAAGVNYGLELEVNYYINERTRSWVNLGLLETEFRDFLNFSHANANADTGTPVDLEGREQPHAPSYQAAVGVEFDVLPYLSWRIDAEAKDSFFLSARHEEQTESYVLWNTRLTYQRDSWQLALWGRNLTDEDTIIRGFGSFGNNPQNFYQTEPYYQLGAPRVIGISATLNFE